MYQYAVLLLRIHVDQMGEFSLEAYDGSTLVHDSSLPIENQGSPFFDATPGSTNELAVQAKDDSISVFVNGHQVTSVKDTTNASGTVGITVDAPSRGTAEVLFTNSAVWTL